MNNADANRDEREELDRLETLFVLYGMEHSEAFQLALDLSELQWSCVSLSTYIGQIGKSPGAAQLRKDAAGLLGRFSHIRKHERGARKAVSRLWDKLYQDKENSKGGG